MKAVVRKEKILLTTYPYSDPAPVPEFGRIYPYNRYDGYALEGSEETWEMVVMENQHIKVWINPASGGKVWGAVEKSTGKEFIYFNHTAKFRDVAMRGPWTSGGIEFNVGILGHALSCSSPVDYQIRENSDGSVSCFIGATDWPSRTRWFVEISLTDDAAWFRTRTSWYNNSGEDQAYYSWSNAGIKTSGGLEYIFPGNAYLGHDGKAHSWPVDAKGRDLSKYENNGFGHYKSYHIIGSPSDFWGCYWRDDRFGMAHYSLYDQKPGKKIWIWGLSRYGMIWEDLLTDEDGQYTEVQSGRLFNQSISSSSRTPFKHRSFLPGSFDTWDEYWMPVKETGGLSYACPALSFYFDTALHICANQPLTHILKIEDKNGVVVEMELKMKTMENVSVISSAGFDKASFRLWLDDVLVYDAQELKYDLKRPVEITSGYKYDSVEGLYLQGKEWERQRFFARARVQYEACLAKDPNYVRALAGMAALKLRVMEYEEGLAHLVRALSIDSYDGEINYLYGMIHSRLGNMYDAKDGFSIAGQSLAYRTAALTELAKLMVCQQQYSKALGYLNEVLASNAGNCQAYQLQVVVLRMMGKGEAGRQLAEKMLQKDPLDHLLRYEVRYEVMGGKNFAAGVGSEWPHETFIEVASFYAAAGVWEDALKVLLFAPEHPMVELWKVYLSYKLGRYAVTLEKALAMSPEFVFPHRHEDIAILRWAVGQTKSWKVKYYLALGLIQFLKEKEALELLEACGNEPDYYPFYLVRARLNTGETDLLHAFEMAPDAWRTALQLCKFYAGREQWKKALLVAQEGFASHPDNYYLGLLLAKCYMYNEQFDAGVGLMKELQVLPNEGASEGRNVWRETNLHAAIAAVLKKNWDIAIDYIHAARTWPENIGVGRPYDVDERLEDFLEYYCLIAKGSSEAGAFKQRIISFRDKNAEWPVGSGDLLPLLFEDGIVSGRRWLDQGEDNLPMRWSRAFLEGNEKKIDELSGEQYVLREALPYEILFEDREFTLIRKMYNSGLLTTKN